METPRMFKIRPEMAVRFDYSRGGRQMSLCKTDRLSMERTILGAATKLGAPSLARLCFCAKGGRPQNLEGGIPKNLAGGRPRILLLAAVVVLAALPATAQY